MSGTNIANSNGWEGLLIETNGTVALTNLGAPAMVTLMPNARFCYIHHCGGYRQGSHPDRH